MKTLLLAMLKRMGTSVLLLILEEVMQMLRDKPDNSVDDIDVKNQKAFTTKVQTGSTRRRDR
jgi:hypothetical protein